MGNPDAKEPEFSGDYIRHLMAAKDGGQNEEVSTVANSISALLRLITNNQGIDEITKAILDRMHASKMTAFDFGLLSHILQPKKRMDIAYNAISEFLEEKYDVTAGSKFMRAWCNSNVEDRGSAISAHLKQTIALGQENPDIIRTLSDEFGIMDFWRYPKEMLVRQ